MTTKPNDGGPAYPIHIPAGSGCGPHIHEGMTLRDHFAGLAMQGMLASETVDAVEEFARVAYRLADAMLAEREKGGAA